MKKRLMHTMLRVRDKDVSTAFYTQQLGMEVVRQTDYPSGRFTNTFIGYQAEDDGPVLELTHNWDRTTTYEMGEAYGHIAIGVSNLYELCEQLRSQGVPITREPGPMKDSPREIAFITDPDGYKIELIQI